MYRSELLFEKQISELWRSNRKAKAWIRFNRPFFISSKPTKGEPITFTQNIRSDIISIEVDSDERTYDRFTEYSYLPADGSGSLLRPVYGQVGGDASV